MTELDVRNLFSEKESRKRKSLELLTESSTVCWVSESQYCHYPLKPSVEILAYSKRNRCDIKKYRAIQHLSLSGT